MKRPHFIVLISMLLSFAPQLFATGNLFINEVLFKPPTSTENPFEYVELRGAAGEIIPDKTYLLAIEGATNNPGKIRNYFELGGKQIGTNGFLVLLQKTHSYATTTGSTVLSNTASKAGWGDLPDSTIGHCGDNGRTNIINAPLTLLLVRCTNAPDPHLDTDTNDDGQLDGEAAGWTILDGIGVLGAEPAGSYGYGKVNFIKSGGSGSGTNVVLVNFTGSYVGRNGHTIGWASNDWVVADVVTNGVTKWKLHSSNVHPTSRANALLDHIGKSNFGATFNYTPLLAHVEALSGVINHPGNPVLLLTVSDTETALSALQVSATSLDTNALPTNRVTVVYTNSQWSVRFSPTNVCYNTPVRLRVSDGTNYSENILPYAASGLWATNVGFHLGISDASTAIPVNTNYMIVGDDETFSLRLYTRTNCGLPIKEFTFTNSLALTNLDGEELAEMDLEASSRYGDRIYWLGSLGNITDGPLAPNRNRIYATDISGSGTNVQLTYVGRYDKLRDDILKWDAEGKHGKGAGYYGLETSAAVLHPPKTNDGFVVEGFTFIANGGSNQAYIGMRAPLVPRGERRRALLIPVLNLGSLVTNNPAAGPAQLGGPVELDLGGRSIRSIEFINGSYWIVAGPPGESTDDPYEFRLFTWSGNVLEPAQMWSASFAGIRPEGIVSVRTNGATVEIQVIGDQGFSKLYEPVTSSSTKKLSPLAFRQFRLDWVPVGTPESLQVMAANFATTGAYKFVRGIGSSNQWLTVVEALDNIPGIRLDDGGGNANSYYPGHNWTNQLRHWNSTNTTQALLFTNPLAAFGSLAGMPTLYAGRMYHFHIAAGTALGTNHQTFRVTAYNRTTKQQVGWQEVVLPSPADTNYPIFFERGLVFNLPNYGLDSRIRPQFSGGAPLHEFTVEQRASKAEYFFVVSLSGQVISNSVTAPVVWSGNGAGAVASPLYVLNFDLEPAWQSHFLAQPHLRGEPAPSAFLGNSVEELRSTNLVNNMSLVVTQALSTLTNVDLSPELRIHSRLDRLVSDYDRDPLALANYVLNEVLLTDAFSPGAASSVLRSGGVRRGALGAYLEGQASPAEQCAMLVYLLRRCQIPCGYVFPASGTLKLHQNMLERLFPFAIQVSGSTNGNALVETDFPCVAAYVDGTWRILAPWLKDLEVQEGLDITDYTPPRYRTGRDWVMGYLRFDQELMKLAFKSDTPTTLFPRYLKQMLQDNYTGLTLEDFGVRVRTRKHHYSRWSDFPMPAVLTGTNTVIESMAVLMQSQSSYSNLFERVEVQVTSTTNSSRTLSTGKFRVLDLQNRLLELWFVETNGSHWMNLGLNPFRPEITNAVVFSNAVASSLSSTQTLNELKDSVLLDATDDELTLRLTWHRYQPPTYSGSAVLPTVTLFQPDRATNATVIERKLRKGDLSTIYLDAGQFSTRMVESLAEDAKRVRAMTNSSGVYLRPEWVSGLTASTASGVYFQRTDVFRGALARFYKTHVDSARAVAVSSLLAKRQTNGLLLSGAIQLSRPRFDVCFREISLIGNGSLRPDVNSANERAAQDFLDLNALNEGAQEHQMIVDQFGSSNVVSTVRLLQLSQLQGYVSLPGILKLTATNYAAYGNTEYGEGAAKKKLKDFDPVTWQTVESVFVTSGLSNAALVLMTPGEVNSDVGKRLGALILSPRYHAALLSPGLNGTESDDATAVENGGTGSPTLFGNDGQWHELDWFGHDIFGGDNAVAENPRIEDNGIVPPWSIETIQSARQPLEVTLQSPAAQEQFEEAIESNPLLEAELESDYGLPPWATAEDIVDAIEDGGYLSRSSMGPDFGDSVMDPVSPINGEFSVNKTDLLLPGPLPLAIARNYSSRSLGEGDFGANWKINLTPYLVVLPNQNYVDAAEPDGTVLRYAKISANSWKPLWQDNALYDNSNVAMGPARNLINRIIERTNSATVTNFVLRPGDGSARVYTWRGFPKNGKSYQRPWLTSWVDSRGNALRVEYGEDALAFDYAKVRRVSSTSGAAVILRYNECGLISELVSKDGQRVRYSYNRWGDLMEVILPDDSRENYVYLFEPSKRTSAVATNSLEAWVPFTNTVGKIDYQRGIIGTVKWTNLISTHRILREEMPDGRMLVNEYDSKGRVTKQFANVGLDQRPVQNAAFIYQNDDTGNTGGASGLLNGTTLLVDGLGNTNQFAYSKSKVTLITDAEGNKDRTDWFLDWYTFTTWDQDWWGNWYPTQGATSYPRSKSSVTNPRGLLTSYKYDSSGNVTNIAVRGDLLGDGNTNTTAVTSIFYTTNNLPARVIHPSGNTNLYFYTNGWLLAREEIWPLGASASDAITNLFDYVSVTNSTNGYVSYGLRSLEVRAAYSPDAATNRFEYDERGFPTRVIRQTGTSDPDFVLNNKFSPRGWLEEQADAAGRRTRFAYDGMGRPQLQEVFEAGATRPISWNFSHYNGNGDVVWTDGPRFGPEDYTWNDFDGGGRPTQTIRWRSRAKADGTSVEAETGANEFSMAFADYDVFGNQTRTIDPRGNIVSNRFDRIGRLTQTEWYSSTGEFLSRESYGYEPGGQLAAHTNALGGFTLVAYNSWGWPISRRNDDGSTNRWLYTLDGRLYSEFARNGAYWRHSYDDKNRRITRTFYNSANVALATNVSEFDRRGNLVRYVDAGGFVSTNRFDALDRIKITAGPAIISVTPTNLPTPGGSGGPITNIVQQVVTNFYDAAGVVFTNINALREKFVMYRDALGRPTRVEIRDKNNALIREANVAYAEDHHSITVTNGSGATAIVSTTFTDADDQPVLSVTYPAAGVREFVQWSYDVAGNLVAESRKSSTNGTVTTWTSSAYTYDGLNRLRTKAERDGAPTSFAFDPAGNLTNHTVPGGLQRQASYNSAGQLIQDYLIGAGGAATMSNSFSYYSASSPWAGLLQSRIDGRGVTCVSTYDDWLRTATNTHTGSLAEHNFSSAWKYDVRGLATNITESFTNGSIGLPTTIRRTYDAYGLQASEQVLVNGSLVSSASQSWDSAGRRFGMSLANFGYAFAWDADEAMASVTGPTGGGSYGYDTAGRLISRTVGRKSVSITSRDGAGRALVRDTVVDGIDRLYEDLAWTGDGLLSTHTQTREDFTDSRSYSYAAQTRWLVDERLNLSISKRWTNTFVYDGGAAMGPGVLTRAGPSSTNLVYWRGGADAFARVGKDTNSVLRQAAYGRVNAYSDSVSVRATLDGQPQDVAVISTGTSNWPTQWRATLDLAPGAHQLIAIANHGTGLFTTNTSRWFTNTAGQMNRSSTFDSAGQITQRVWTTPSGATNRTQTLTWDALGRLLKVAERDGTNSGFNWSAVYDGLDRRIQTFETPVTNGNVLTSQTRTITSYFDPEVEFQEMGVSVNGKATWKLYGPDANDDYGGLNGQGGFDAIIPGPELFCPVITDARGDVLAVYDQDHGSLMWNQARSGAYGGVPGYRPVPLGHGAELVPASAYAGIWMDSTRYYWRGERYYDSESSQWLSFDPYGFDASDNSHGYLNDPVNYTDPDGRFGAGLLGFGGGVGGGGSGGGGGGGKRRPDEDSLAFKAGDFVGRQLEQMNLNPFRQAVALDMEYRSNLSLFGGNHFNALNQTFNPATKAMFGFDEAVHGRGLNHYNLGLELTTGERRMAFGQGVLHSVETVGTAVGLRSVPGTLRGGFRGAPAGGPPPLPGTTRGMQIRVNSRAGELGGVNVSGANSAKSAGRAGKQARLKQLADDPNVSSADRGWIRQEMNSIDRGQRPSIRVPPGKNLAHRRGLEAKKGYGYEHSDLQDIDLHKLQHKREGY